MDNDRVEGSAKQVKGAIKEGVGKVTGDTKTQAEGQADKAEGKVQNAVGGAKDAARDAINKTVGRQARLIRNAAATRSYRGGILAGAKLGRVLGALLQRLEGFLGDGAGGLKHRAGRFE